MSIKALDDGGLKSVPIDHLYQIPAGIEMISIEMISIEMVHNTGTVSDSFPIVEGDDDIFMLENVYVGSNQLNGFARSAERPYIVDEILFVGQDVVSSLKGFPLWSNYTCNQVVEVLSANNGPIIMDWNATHGCNVLRVKFEDTSMTAYDYTFIGKSLWNGHHTSVATFMYNGVPAIDGVPTHIEVVVNDYSDAISSEGVTGDDLEILTVRAGITKVIDVLITADYEMEITLIEAEEFEF